MTLLQSVSPLTVPVIWFVLNKAKSELMPTTCLALAGLSEQSQAAVRRW